MTAAAAAAAAYPTPRAESALAAGGAMGSNSGSNSNTTAFGCPKHPVYNKPWVKNNVVLTYNLGLKDGLGAQVQRIMGIYAMAQALGIGYIHSPFRCIGHIGPHYHYRENRTCDNLGPKQQHELQRITTYLSLPNTTSVNVSTWARRMLFMGTWDSLAAMVQQAEQQQQPTVIGLEMLTRFLPRCHDLFHHVPEWRPDWSYQQPGQRVRSNKSAQFTIMYLHSMSRQQQMN